MVPRLTLICPTYERSVYLKRSFRFWSDQAKFRVLYGDGSQVSSQIECRNTGNISYFHEPSKGLYQRLLQLLRQVKTPYVCLIGDDEFYIPSSLSNCVDFLDESPDFVACSGRALGFSRSGANLLFSRQYPRLKNRILDSDLPFTRLSQHFSSYVPAHCYAVTRTDVFSKAMELALGCKLDIFAIFELIYEISIVSYGKTCVLPTLHWLRSHEAPPIRNTGDLSLNTNSRFNDWWFNNNPFILRERRALCHELSIAFGGMLNTDQITAIFDIYAHNTTRSSTPSADRHVSLSSLRLMQIMPKILSHFSDLMRATYFCLSSPNRLSLQNQFVLQDLRNQGVYIDEEGLSQCLVFIKKSWGLCNE